MDTNHTPLSGTKISNYFTGKATHQDVASFCITICLLWILLLSWIIQAWSPSPCQWPQPRWYGHRPTTVVLVLCSQHANCREELQMQTLQRREEASWLWWWLIILRQQRRQASRWQHKWFREGARWWDRSNQEETLVAPWELKGTNRNWFGIGTFCSKNELVMHAKLVPCFALQPMSILFVTENCSFHWSWESLFAFQWLAQCAPNVYRQCAPFKCLFSSFNCFNVVAWQCVVVLVHS